MVNHRLSSQPRFADAPADGWAAYQRALDLIVLSNWSQALLVLAEAETLFHIQDDADGLWRALLGQALLHWREGMAALAMARGAAALRMAETTDDGFAVGCVAWQIAHMLLGEAEYLKAAEYLDQAQLALDAVNMAPPGGTLASAAQLCNEIVRWQQRYERQQIARHDAEIAIAEIQDELIARLNCAASSMRNTPLLPAPLAGAELLLLMPPAPPLLELPTEAAHQGLRVWLRRLWRRLVYGEDLATVEALTQVADLPLPPSDVSAMSQLVALAPARGAVMPRVVPEPVALEQADTSAATTVAPGLPEYPFSTIDETEAPAQFAEAAPTTRLEPPVAATLDDAATSTPALAPEIAVPLADSEADAQPELALLASPEPAVPAVPLPCLQVQLLGDFRATLNGHGIDSWPSGRGRAVFKYLLAHRDRAIPRDVLMELFWPDASSDAARNSLNVALYGLRQALRAASPLPVVLFQDSAYRLNPELCVELDVDAFKRCVQAGRRSEDADDHATATARYEQAAALYLGDFMADDLSDDWPVLVRERLRVAYLDTLDRLGQLYYAQEQYEACVTLCLQLLGHDSCREDAHCRLMRCYSRLGQHHLALRQYQACVEALHKELGVEPDEATQQLCARIRRREVV